jgi:hypothetical protein
MRIKYQPKSTVKLYIHLKKPSTAYSRQDSIWKFEHFTIWIKRPHIPLYLVLISKPADIAQLVEKLTIDSKLNGLNPVTIDTGRR